MADVSSKCVICGTEVKVSEFADASLLKCPTCGGRMAMSKQTEPRKAPTVLKRTTEAATSDGTVDSGQSTDRRPRFRRKKKRNIIIRFANLEISGYALSWVLFLLLCPALCYVRWGGIVTDEMAFSDLKAGGMWAAALLYVVVLLAAFKDEMFDGLLSLFIWPYGLYYLFVKSDIFFLRAVVASVFIAFGFDIVIITYAWGMDFYEWSMYMIHEGALK